MKGLTEKQRKILNFIHSFINQYDYSPSYREIMDHFSFSSPGSVHKYISTLKRKGVLIAEKSCSRSMKPTEEYTIPLRSSEVTLPLIGTLSTGNALELFIKPQNLTVPPNLVPHAENTYILRIEGNGSEEEMIMHGDLILVEARQEVQSGELIVGVINSQDPILKHYYPEEQYIRLESRAHQSLVIRPEHLHIHGVIVGLIRAY